MNTLNDEIRKVVYTMVQNMAESCKHNFLDEAEMDEGLKRIAVLNAIRQDYDTGGNGHSGPGSNLDEIKIVNDSLTERVYKQIHEFVENPPEKPTNDDFFGYMDELVRYLAKIRKTTEYTESQIDEVCKAIALLWSIEEDFDCGGTGIPGENSYLDEIEITESSWTDRSLEQVIELFEFARGTI